MNSTDYSTALIDAHVHLHHCFDPPSFFSAAHANFSRQARSLGTPAWHGFLLFTETQSAGWFSRLAGRGDANPVPGWSVERLDEAPSLALHGPGQESLVVIAGQQIITSERLEILAIGAVERIPDGSSMEDTLSEARAAGAIRVLPWGNGKWLGGRGRVVDRLIRDAAPGEFYLGDNSGRLRWLPAPREFSQGRRKGLFLLPGSDPLPFPSELSKVGSYGFSIGGTPNLRRPFSWLRDELAARPEAITHFGQRERLDRFVRNQAAMQMRKWVH